MTSPSPAMVVALIALAVALTGTAVAGVAAVAVLSKGEKKQVRSIAAKIADKRITRRAPGLSVANAGSADTARIAGSAVSANVAASASNQLWAVVAADGRLVRSSAGIVSSIEAEVVGRYIVTANRDISKCSYQATLGGDQPDEGFVGELSVTPLSANADSVYVHTAQSNGGSSISLPFSLLISC